MPEPRDPRTFFMIRAEYAHAPQVMDRWISLLEETGEGKFMLKVLRGRRDAMKKWQEENPDKLTLEGWKEAS